MNINPIQSGSAFNQLNLSQKEPSFKRITVSEKYFGPFEKYAAEGQIARKNQYVNYLKQKVSSLRLTDAIHPDYVYNILCHVYPTERVSQYFNQKDGYKSDIAAKYNKMVDSLGDQADDLDIFVYPPPLCQDEDHKYTVYAVPALGIYDYERDCGSYNKNRIMIQNPNFHSRENSFRWLVLPSDNLIGNIIINIYEKLDGFLKKGIESKAEKIIIPESPKTHSSMFDDIIAENDRFESFAKHDVDMIFNPTEPSRSCINESSPYWNSVRRRESAELKEWIERHDERQRQRRQTDWEREHGALMSGYSGW